MQGTVKKIDKLHPYGWIALSEGGREIFFHAKTLAPGAAFPAQGDFVVFQISTDSRGRTCATGVRKATTTAEKYFRPAKTGGDGPIRFGSNP